MVFGPTQVMSGPQEWDLDALEHSTRYDGFTREHPVVKYGFAMVCTTSHLSLPT